MIKGRKIARHTLSALVLSLVVLTPSTLKAGYERTFEAGSLVIPMDLSYQNHGMLQAYGLVFQLLHHGIAVYWVIDNDKTWHATSCDTTDDECTWDCFEEGSGIKCAYPTASPDFYVSADVLWDGDQETWDTDNEISTSDPISNHGYRGGPFVIDSADSSAALEIIDLWNDQAEWPDADQCPPLQSSDEENCWARRSTFQVVTVHQTTTSFQGKISKRMVAAPTIAVFSDGNEDIATSYLRAAGIPQSNGNEFPEDKCGTCGPGTTNPDMLTVQAIMGEMGTCTDQNYNHKNGALFNEDGLPAYCQIMSMHWGVNDRNTVACDDDDNLTYHGHEVVAEVRQFLNYPTHFFAECQAVNAYENTVPNEEAPFLDDSDRIGHFLTTIGTPPSCGDNDSCDGADFDKVECVADGCDSGTRDCCMPSDAKEIGAGFLIGEQPATEDVKVLAPAIPYNQLDGMFGTTGGSEKSYNLSTFLGTEYKNNLDITFLTGPDGPGKDDIWMTGYLDGACAIHSEGGQECQGVGKVSYLGGHKYTIEVPISQNWETQGTRMFLNALFEADCVTAVGQPNLILDMTGETVILVDSLPITETYTIDYENLGIGSALDSVLILTVPAEASVDDYESNGSTNSDGIEWTIGSIGSYIGAAGDPDTNGSRWVTVSFDTEGEYLLEAQIQYRVGVSILKSNPIQVTIKVAFDSDGDSVPDDEDPNPDDPNQCGDADNDTCDDCSVAGKPETDNDGSDRDGDGLCDDGDPDPDEPSVVSPEKDDAGMGSNAGSGATAHVDGGGIPSDGGDQDGNADSSGCQCNTTGSSSFGLLHILIAFTWIAIMRRRRTLRFNCDTRRIRS